MKTRPSSPRSRQQKRRWFLTSEADARSIRRSRRLQLEALEDRRVLATLYVDQTPTLVGPGADVFTASGGTQTSTGGLTLNTNLFTTIQAAIDAAGPTDTINVADGAYHELVSVNKAVTLRGNQFGVDARTRGAVNESIVDGAIINAPLRSTAFNITASGATVDGFVSQDQNDNNVFNAGIVMASTTSGVAVRNNIVRNNVIGIFAGSSGASIIERNLIDGNNAPGPAGGAGIYTESTVGLTIDNNELRNHTANNPILFAALGAGAHTNVTVSNNFIHDNVSGIFALGITGGVFSGNTISTAGTATALTFGGADTGIDVLNNDLSGNLRGLRIADFGFLGATPNSDIEAHFNNFAGNSEYGVGISNEGIGLTDGYTGPLDVTCNWWGDLSGPTSAANPGGAGVMLRNDFADSIDFQPWLLYSDASPAAVGFQIPTSFAVPAQVAGFTTTNNNYRRLVNAIDCLQPGQTVVLSGNFDWTEPNAAGAWAVGNDGALATADDFSLLVRPNLNNITLTAASLGAARIQGPGDLAAANLEGVFVFDGGDNQNLTISNLEIFDFDLAIGMFNGAGGADAFSGTQILNNRIRIPADLNATVAPADVNQNIGIHFSFGTNQTIQNNTIDIAGNGVSNSGGGNTASSVGMQSNTSGGSVYDGLLIDNNTINILNAQSADPERILGIWENGHAHTSDITVSNNDFVNLAAGNNPALNLQRAFRVTSHSSASTTVTYTGNTASGANIGFEWIGGSNFAGNQAVRLWQNVLTNNDTGVLVQSGGVANLYQNTITGSGAGGGVHVVSGSLTGSGPVTNAVQENFISGGSGDGLRIEAGAGPIGPIFDNDLGGNAGFGLNNGTATTLVAEFNWWGTNTAPGVAAEVNGPVDFDPWLTIGTDIAPATPGFQGFLSIITSGTSTFFTGTPGDDTLTITATSDNDASFVLVRPDGTFTGTLTDATFIQFDALGGNDRLTIINPAGGLFAPTSGILYNGGGQAGDSLQDLGGAATSGFYSPGPTSDAGILSHTTGALTQTITFTGLAPIDDTVAEATFTINATAAANTIIVSNGPVVLGTQTINVAIDAFEPINFGNKTNVDINGLDGADGVRLSATIPATGLATLDVFGQGTGVDDSAADVVQVDATLAGVATGLFGGGGNDLFHNEGFAPFGTGTRSLANFAGPLTINGDAGSDTMAFSDSATAGPDTVTVTATQIVAGASTINYSNLEIAYFEATQGDDTIDILSTQLGAATVIGGDGGSDTITVGNTAADFAASVFDGSLDAILGGLILLPDGNSTAGAADVLNLDDSGTAGLNAPATVALGGAFVPLPDGASISGNATTFGNFAPAPIVYFHDNVAANAVLGAATFANRLETLNVRTSTGADTVAVNATTATLASNYDFREGADAVTIAGDALSAANTFSGFTGNDTFTLNIATHLGSAAFAPLTSVTISGNDPAASSENRDRLNINDNNGAFVRNLNYDYLDTAGDLDVLAGAAGAGLAGPVVPSLALQVRSMETIVTTSTADNDVVRVTGLSTDDDLTAVPRAGGEALVFSGGNPYLEAPPVSVAGFLPGLAGGGRGPDLRIDGIGVVGLTLDGSGVGGGQGNRAIVQATSEAAVTTGGPLDIFGFGAGVLIPGSGVGNAYDTINVTDAQVTTTNNALGALTTINLATSSFVQTTPPSPFQRPGLVVNGGDEAAPQASGIADNITAAVSANFNIQINGNLPLLTLGPDGLPLGDQLNLTGPGDINIFSDKTTPPNVTVTFSGNAGPFGISHSSIERLRLDADAPGASGAVNLIGDNNNGAIDQNDNFVVRGRDIDGNLLDAGYQEMTVSINGSAPILIDGVQRLNVYGDDRNPAPGTPSVGPSDIDTLDIRAYADNAANPPNNAPRGWGVDVFFNEGNPAGTDGNQADLIIYHTSAGLGGGGSVSEDIAIVPSGVDSGEIRATNATDGSVIVVLQYVANTDIVVLDDDGALADTDTLTLNGTNPDTTTISGRETFVANFTAAGDLANPLVTVTDTVGGASLYRLRNFTGFGSITINPLGGGDTVNLTNRAGLTVNVNGGDPAAMTTINDALNVTVAGSARISQGATSTEGRIDNAGVGDVNFTGFENVGLISTGGGTFTARGTHDNDTFALDRLGANDLVWINDGPVISFAGFTTVDLQGLFGADTFSISPIGVAAASILVTGGDPTAADEMTINGDALANVIAFTPTAADAGSVAVSGSPTVTFTTVEKLLINGLGGGDSLTINGTAADDTTVTNPTGGGSGTFRSSASPALDFTSYLALTVTGGAGGFDQVEINGTNGIDTVTSDADTIFFAGAGNVTVDAAIDRLALNVLDGNDSVNLSLFTTLGVVIDGGAGSDTIVGTGLADTIGGGAGNDTINGGAGIDVLSGNEGNDTLDGDGGADQMLGGDGSDLFIWDPGDGSDLIEGGANESDVLRFNGAAGAEIFTLNAVGTRVELLRSVGAIDMDIAGVEQIDLLALGGADSVTVNDLFATDLRVLNIDAGGADAASDSILAVGREVSDTVSVTLAAGVVSLAGLTYDINVAGISAPDTDTLTFNARGGNDTVNVADALNTLFASSEVTILGGDGNDFLSGFGTLSGEAGNDALVGGAFGQTISGGDGDDQVFGGGGDDILSGGAGEDQFVGGLGNDSIDGGADFDTILVQGNSANNRIDAIQDSPTQIRYEISDPVLGQDGVVGTGGGTETDALAAGTVEQVTILAGSGDDLVRVTHSDSLIAGGLQSLSLRFTVDGGAPGASDRLTVVDDGFGDTTIHRIGGTPGTGSYQIGGLAPVVYTDIEFASLSPINPITSGTGTNGLGRLFVFKHDGYEENNSRLNATFLGSGEAINVDPTIDPGYDLAFDSAGDEDWYRIVAQNTGDLDIRVFFQQYAGYTDSNGLARPGLPGDGNLDVALYDIDGQPLPIGGTGAFGANDATDDERIRIPAVAGQTYYLRVRGAPAGGVLNNANHALPNTSAAVNVYNLSVINTPAPVPFDLELDDAPVNGATNPPGQTDNSDTGRSQLDNITYDNTPTILLRVSDSALLLDIPQNGTSGEPGAPPDGTVIPIPFQADAAANALAAGFRVAVLHVENNTHAIVGYALPVAGSPGLYSFTFPTALADGSHFLAAAVEMVDPANPEQAQGLGGLSQSLEIVVDTLPPPVSFGLAGVAGDGLLPESDSGLNTNPETLEDGVTTDTTPGFFGEAEADAVIRLFIDAPEAGFPTGNGVFNPAIDFQVGFDVAEPFDGTNQYPNGYWQIDAINTNLNAAPFSPVDGLRRLFITAEDVAGNINPGVGQIVQQLSIFVDTQGPQITDVTINSDTDTFNLFDPKPATDGPTPLVNSLWIDIQDLPGRVLPDFDQPAFKPDIAAALGHYRVQGDANGIIPILGVNVVLDPAVNGQPATGRVQLVFRTPGPDGVFNTSDDIGSPLPDDRFTLTVSENGIIDFAGNKLDGESNAAEPLNSPPGAGQPVVGGVDGEPTGDGLPGGSFVARFTVDSRPELGVWAAGSAFLDINGNTIWDPNNTDLSNRDISHVFGFTSDDLFAGNFASSGPDSTFGTPDDRAAAAGTGLADGFDKLAAYGRVGTTTFRWLIDTDNDGVADIERLDPRNINGLPVAGRFDGINANGDEVGLFTGSTWWFDTNHDFQVDTSVAWPVAGHAIVGDFDGDGLDDLATWTNDTFSFDLSSIDADANAADNVLAGIDGTIERTVKFGFIGPGERPVAADMNQDGIEDLGLWVPARDGITPRATSEWYFLLSGVTPNDTLLPSGQPDTVNVNLGPTITGSGDPTPGSYLALPNAFYGLSNYTTGRIVVDPLTPAQNIVRFQPVPFGNDLFMQFGDEFGLPLVGNFDPPVNASGETTVTNPRNANDVNNDGDVNVLDLLAVVNYLTEHGSGAAPAGGFLTAPFCDVTADNLVNTLDLLAVVNYITQQYAIQGQSEGEGEGSDGYFANFGAAGGGDDDDLLSTLATDR